MKPLKDQDAKGKKYTNNVKKVVKSKQESKSNFDKLSGVTTSKGSGIDPITNTSYRKK